MLEQLTATINANSLLSKNDSVLVALSGGPDSVVLLHLLTRLRKKMRLRLSAVYVNHQIRPRAAREDEQFCAGLCARLDVPLQIVVRNIPEEAKSARTGLEETARNVRYEIFEAIADTDNCDRIAVGHHLDDRAETVLFRIVRGTGISGLAGIPVKRSRIIRPLHDISREQILNYIKEQKLSYRIDRSNLNTKQDRNYIRNRLLPEIRSRLNPAVNAALVNLSDTAGDDDKFLETEVDRALRRVAGLSDGAKIELDLAEFKKYHISIRRRLIRRCLIGLSSDGLPFDRRVVERVEQLIAGHGKAVSLPDGIQAARYQSSLIIFKSGKINFSRELCPPKSCRIDELALILSCRTYDRQDRELVFKRRSQSVMVDFDKLKPPLMVRNIRPVDRFQPLGMRGSKKVGDFLADRRVDRVLRDEIPVVVDADGIIWVVGHEIADRVKIESATKKVLNIELRKNRKLRAEAVRATLGPR